MELGGLEAGICRSIFDGEFKEEFPVFTHHRNLGLAERCLTVTCGEFPANVPAVCLLLGAGVRIPKFDGDVPGKFRNGFPSVDRMIFGHVIHHYLIVPLAD